VAHEWVTLELDDQSLLDDFLLESEMGESVSSSGYSVPISISNGDGFKRLYSEQLRTLTEEIEDLETSKSTKEFNITDNSSIYNSRHHNRKRNLMQVIDEENNASISKSEIRRSMSIAEILGD